MKTFKLTLFVMICLILLYSCGASNDQSKTTLTSIKNISFIGKVRSTDGKPIPSAPIKINGQEISTNKAGYFNIKLKPHATYLINVNTPGFGLYSKKFHALPDTLSITLYKGTKKSADPTRPIRISDIRTDCPKSLSSMVDWSAYPQQAIPRVFAGDGRYIGTDVSAVVREVINYISNSPCSNGIAISIPANALEDKDGRKPTGNVEVSVSTIDLMAPDAMPGDYTVQTKEGEVYMQSFGAGSVTITSDGKEYQLNNQSQAEITIPVAPSAMRKKSGNKLPEKIPLLFYDEKKGVWREDGVGYLNKDKNAYVGKLTHFSTFNMDELKVNQSCIRINSAGIDGPFKLEMSWLEGENIVNKVQYIANPLGDQLHALYNLPNNTDIVIRPFREGNFDWVPLGTYVVNSGPPQNPTDPNEPAYPYNACQAELVLVENMAIPVLVGPAYNVAGPFDLTAYYTWPAGVHGPTDGYLLQESTTSDSWPSAPIRVTNTGPSNSWNDISKPPGAYYFRTLVIENSANSPYSNVVTVNVIPELDTKLRVHNKISASDQVILRLRIGYSKEIVLANPTLELLEPDNYCGSTIGRDIGSEEATEFDVSDFGPNYYVAMSAGKWNQNVEPCATGYSKGFVDSNGLYNYLVVSIGNQNAGLYNLEITFSGGRYYVNGIPFETSEIDPFE